jgi:D-3-phosphoglycerate dehydrogenase
LEASGVNGLQGLGCDVVHEPDLKDEILAAAIGSTEAEVLIVRSTKVTEPMMEGSKLRLIIRAGAGYNTIDVKAAAARSIFVSNCPGMNSVAVAELAMGLLLSLDRRIADNVADLRAGVWNKKEYGKAKGIHGTTLGLVGLGQIGQETAVRAKAFGMNVIGWSRSLTPEKAAALGIGHRASIADVARDCDTLSIHLALNEQTRGVINADIFDAMKPGSFFINTSRAEVVDQAALVKAIETKGLRAGLDVFANEPSGATGEFEDSIVKLPGVHGTHHIGASTDQAQEAVATETVRIVQVFQSAGTPPNVVNPF